MLEVLYFLKYFYRANLVAIIHCVVAECFVESRLIIVGNGRQQSELDMHYYTISFTILTTITHLTV